MLWMKFESADRRGRSLWVNMDQATRFEDLCVKELAVTAITLIAGGRCKQVRVFGSSDDIASKMEHAALIQRSRQ